MARDPKASWKRPLPHQGLLMTTGPSALPRETPENSLVFLLPYPWGPGPNGCGVPQRVFGILCGDRRHFSVAGEGCARHRAEVFIWIMFLFLLMTSLQSKSHFGY